VNRSLTVFITALFLLTTISGFVSADIEYGQSFSKTCNGSKCSMEIGHTNYFDGTQFKPLEDTINFTWSGYKFNLNFPDGYISMIPFVKVGSVDVDLETWLQGKGANVESQIKKTRRQVKFGLNITDYSFGYIPEDKIGFRIDETSGITSWKKVPGEPKVVLNNEFIINYQDFKDAGFTVRWDASEKKIRLGNITVETAFLFLDPVVTLNGSAGVLDDIDLARTPVSPDAVEWSDICGVGVTFSQHAIIKWNITDITSNATITNAQMQFFLEDGEEAGDANLSMHHVFVPNYNLSGVEWTESTITNATQPKIKNVDYNDTSESQVIVTVPNNTINNLLTKVNFSVSSMLTEDLIKGRKNMSSVIRCGIVGHTGGALDIGASEDTGDRAPVLYVDFIVDKSNLTSTIGSFSHSAITESDLVNTTFTLNTDDGDTTIDNTNCVFNQFENNIVPFATFNNLDFQLGFAESVAMNVGFSSVPLGNYSGNLTCTGTSSDTNTSVNMTYTINSTAIATDLDIAEDQISFTTDPATTSTQIIKVSASAGTNDLTNTNCTVSTGNVGPFTTFNDTNFNIAIDTTVPVEITFTNLDGDLYSGIITCEGIDTDVVRSDTIPYSILSTVSGGGGGGGGGGGPQVVIVGSGWTFLQDSYLPIMSPGASDRFVAIISNTGQQDIDTLQLLCNPDPIDQVNFCDFIFFEDMAFGIGQFESNTITTIPVGGLREIPFEIRIPSDFNVTQVGAFHSFSVVAEAVGIPRQLSFQITVSPGLGSIGALVGDFIAFFPNVPLQACNVLKS